MTMEPYVFKNPYDFRELSNLHCSEQATEQPTTSSFNFLDALTKIRKKQEEEFHETKADMSKLFKQDIPAVIPTNGTLEVHPNDPNIVPIYSPQFGKKYTLGSFDPTKDMYVHIQQRPKTPYELYMDQVNAARGQAYLNQRQYTPEYQFNNERKHDGRIADFQRHINQYVNDPNQIVKQYWKDKNRVAKAGGVLDRDGVPHDEDDERDNSFNSETENNKFLDQMRMKKEKENRKFQLTPEQDCKIRARDPYDDKCRYNSIITPSINPQYLQYASYMPPVPMTFNETGNPYQQIMDGFNQQKAAILSAKEARNRPKKIKKRPDWSPEDHDMLGYTEYVFKCEERGLSANNEEFQRWANGEDVFHEFDKEEDNQPVEEAPVAPVFTPNPNGLASYSTPQQWNNYYNYCMQNQQLFANQHYRPGYGYMNVFSHDKEGLPTKWFNDNWLYLTPTQEEIDNGEEVGIKLYRNGKLICSNGVERKPKKKEEPKNSEPVVYFVRTKTNEDGSKEISMYDATHKRQLTKEEVHDYYQKEANTSHQFSDDYKFAAIGMSSTPKDFQEPHISSFSQFANVFKSAQEQAEEDEGVNLATELSRYNQFVADNYLWFITILPRNARKNLTDICQNQLMHYRNADEFAYNKSCVLFIGDKVVYGQPKPTTLEEIEELRKKVPYDLSELDKYDTVEEKVKYLQNLRDVRVIDEKDDVAYGAFKKMIKALNVAQGQNKANYDIFKMFMRKIDKDPATFEKRFFKWWTKPTSKLSEKEYRKKYVDRMMQLANDHWEEINKKLIPYEEVVKERIKQHSDFLIKLTHGRILNVKTIADADYVTNCLFNNYNAGVRYRNRNSFYTNETGLASMHEIDARQKEFEKYGGLNQFAYNIYHNPDNPSYNPEPISINPSDPPEVRAQEYINKIMRKKRGELFDYENKYLRY